MPGKFTAWRKSRRSTGASSNCVEVAASVNGEIAVRDTKYRSGGQLVLGRSEWAGLLRSIEQGEIG